MPLFQETTFHDRQCVVEESSHNTSSTIFVDLTGATLTTKDLGSTGTYVLFFSVLLSSSLNNTTATFQLLSGGSPIGGERAIFLRVKDLDIGYTLMSCIDLEKDSVLQVQWKTDLGTITLPEYNIVLDGIPKYRVVE